MKRTSNNFVVLLAEAAKVYMGVMDSQLSPAISEIFKLFLSYQLKFRPFLSYQLTAMTDLS